MPYEDKIALAEDDAGNILYRVENESPAGARSDKFVLYTADNSQIWPMEFSVEDGEIWDLDVGSEPHLPWVRWILHEIYNFDVLERKVDLDHHFEGRIRPRLLSASWEDLAELEKKTVDPRLIADLIRQNKGVTRDVLRQQLSNLFEHPLMTQAMGKVEGGDYNYAMSTVAEWYFTPSPGGFVFRLSVYRRRKANDTVDIGFHLFSGNDRGVTEPSLVEAMRTSGRWVAPAEVDAWYEANVVDPIWIVDPDLLEPYRLVNVAVPFSWEWSAFLTWAKSEGLPVL